LTEKLLLASCPEYGPRDNIAPQGQILVIRSWPGMRCGRIGIGKSPVPTPRVTGLN